MQRYFVEDEDRLTSNIKDYNRHCALCLKNKSLTIHESPPWNHLPLPFAANAMLYVDFFEVPAKAGYNFILVLVDALMLYTRAFPCRKNATGEELCQILWEHWFQAYGIPGEIIADNDVR